MNFDEIIERRGTHSAKWDMMDKLYAVPGDTGISMWVADMDFRPPACVQSALQGMLDHGIYGYFGDDSAYKAAIRWWMQTRHDWEVEDDAILTAHGLVNGTALCVHTFTAPGEGVAVMAPVYHAFGKVVRGSGRRLVELPLTSENGRLEMDLATWDSMIDPGTKMLILCSPHNPGGRVWSQDELKEVAAFCQRHDLILVSDEIHHDLVFAGSKHTVMAKAAPDALDRIVMMTATTKTFNIAGGHTGNIIIPDPALRKRVADTLFGLGISGNSFGLVMATAAYSPEGAAWVDALVDYLDGNRKVFDAGVNAIPGVQSMALEATYLAWVDFAGTGMEVEEFTRRVEQEAGIAANHGSTFGVGGESCLRFNLATPRARVIEAVERLQKAFSDLQ
ncbi:cystathione beta-lyase [Gemmobacter megaterium]|uniref:cysteine-S-conjugate beta-lyase n=1 Tax=Gemmobacter megaterium TaxID=1086013 RepID=A0A1N7Q2Q5_9RHOB|nr:MalY/PatB family protein [Gemmobacter megaterium]GGE22499.1 aminotransferase [Gemmobacter megaterium]SIT17132.1 cystathione beta-lyase [Gemmobacter megaterium]